MGSGSLVPGSVMEIDIRDLFGTICRLTGFSGDGVWDASQPKGQPRRCLVTTRAEALFGFRAHTPFERGLRRTIERYGPTFGTRPSEARRA
jgi:GDP-L-fucose synthase